MQESLSLNIGKRAVLSLEQSKDASRRDLQSWVIAPAQRHATVRRCLAYTISERRPPSYFVSIS